MRNLLLHKGTASSSWIKAGLATFALLALSAAPVYAITVIPCGLVLNRGNTFLY